MVELIPLVGIKGDITPEAIDARDEAQQAMREARQAALDADNSALTAQGARVLYHGTTSDAARPEGFVGTVIWVGSVYPINARGNDLYFESAPIPSEPNVPWDINLRHTGLIGIPNGSEITRWSDAAGNHPVEAVAGSGPICVVPSDGSPRYAQFNSTKYLRALFNAVEPNNQPTTTVMVIAPDSYTSITPRTIYADTAGQNRLGLQQVDDSGRNTLRYASLSTYAYAAGSPAYPTGEWVVLTIAHRGNQVTMRVNGNTVYDNTLIVSAGMSGIVLGSNPNLAGSYVGKIGTFKRLSGLDVSFATINALERALAYQYNITL